jgi:hypothetical protein
VPVSLQSDGWTALHHSGRKNLPSKIKKVPAKEMEGTAKQFKIQWLI